MAELLHWTDDPTGDQRALRFFRQHPKGYQTGLRRSVPSPGGPAVPAFIVTTGDGVDRWCMIGKHWTWDGRKFAAELCTPDCP